MEVWCWVLGVGLMVWVNKRPMVVSCLLKPCFIDKLPESYAGTCGYIDPLSQSIKTNFSRLDQDLVEMKGHILQLHI